MPRQRGHRVGWIRTPKEVRIRKLASPQTSCRGTRKMNQATFQILMPEKKRGGLKDVGSGKTQQTGSQNEAGAPPESFLLLKESCWFFRHLAVSSITMRRLLAVCASEASQRIPECVPIVCCRPRGLAQTGYLSFCR